MRYIVRKDIYILRTLASVIVMLFLLMTMIITGSTPVWASRIFPNLPEEEINQFTGDYDWDVTLTPPATANDYITYSDFRQNYCLYDTLISVCQTAINGKYLRIDTADDLYRFSVDVSYEDYYITGNETEDRVLSWEKKAFLLSLEYRLGKDIDYSVMGAKTFISIGYHLPDAVGYSTPSADNNLFTGIFDGQGFTISNLYVAGYNYLIYEDNSGGTIEYVPTTEYYAMFNYNMGTIKNVGLINPTLEILQYVEDMNSIATLVGYNLGTSSKSAIVDHVYVIDTRTSVLDAGLRYNIGTSAADVKAAGIVHTNGTYGIFTNAYFSSILVVNGLYFNKLDGQPVVYYNSGTITQLAFDDTVYKESVTVGSSTYNAEVKNGLATSETTTMIKSGIDSVLNDSDDKWHFYAADTYPLLLGFDSEGGDFLIQDAIDFVFFARVLSYSTKYDGINEYNEASYRLVNDIDMSTLAEGAYQTPSATFNGSLTGLMDPSDPDYPETYSLDYNYFIYNLNITKGVIRNNNYYAGIFSILGATSSIENINFSNVAIDLTDTETYYSFPFFIGLIAGKNSAGTLENIITHTDVSIDLGMSAIGETHAGGLIGQSSGLISHVQLSGTLDAGIHTISSSYTITPRVYIGGIVGSAMTNQLRIEEAIHLGAITGFSTTSTPAFASGYTNYQIKMGGIVGYLYNTSSFKHQVINVSNKGSIIIRNVTDSTTPDPTQHVGGIFGELAGSAPILEDGSGNYLFANLYNEGNFTATYTTGVAIVRVAGIGVNNASEAIEYALITNGNSDGTNGHLTLTDEPTGTTNTLFRFTGTIFDVGSVSVTLSRVYNHANYTFSTSYFTQISPLYYSLNNTSTLIRYSANYGYISYINNGGATTITARGELSISGISTSTNVAYMNVHNYGNITIVSISLGSYPLYVSGITRELSANFYIKNSLNKGNITIAQISGTGNIYAAGIVNNNRAGDIHELGVNDPIVANEGIINCINYGKITSTYSTNPTAYHGIDGTNNTFAAGIATMNTGSIINCANLNHITIFNSNDNPYMDVNNDSNQYFAGLIEGYTAGVTVGGIVAVVLNGESRIFDTANNGDVIGISDSYVRAGGILATALYAELYGGGITSAMGLVDPNVEVDESKHIPKSEVSNGLNFGAISALTFNIVGYSTGTTTSATYTNAYVIYDSGTLSRSANFFIQSPQYSASEQRIAIYASAGGIIGYGLCTMNNMLNHGTISSTDVAGGIVGATFALGDGEITYVNITTAINYGLIKAISSSSVDSIDEIDISILDIDDYYLDDGNSLILPSNGNRYEPGARRGFGGVFGRLQRGNSGTMTSEGEDAAFDFIVNANPAVNLIGRLDQVYNFTSSSRFFRFNNAKYYSARYNDSTQVVFTGFYYVLGSAYYSGSSAPYTINIRPTTMYKQVGIVSSDATSYTTAYTNTGSSYYCTSTGAPSCTSTSRLTTSSSSPTTNIRAFHSPVQVPWVTENPLDPNITDLDKQYMYDDDFEMRTNSNLTEFIYYMPSILLADKFSARTNGMYVLSTSAGSSVGLALPLNIVTDDIRLLDESSTTEPSLLDYNSFEDGDFDSLDSSIITAYNELRQTKYNEKNELVESTAVPVNMFEHIDGVEYNSIEYDGSNTQLFSGDIDELATPNKTITFTISVDAFKDGQLTADFSIIQALAPANSLIAISPEDYYNTSTPSEAQIKALNDDLVDEAGLSISLEDPPELSAAIPSRSISSATSVDAGYFTVYSEAFINDITLDTYWEPEYYETYKVVIIFLPSISQLPGSNVIDYVSFNGSSVNVNYDTATAVDIRSIGDVNYNGTIEFDFYDTKGIFTPGFDFIENIELYYLNGETPVLVDESYYSISSTPAEVISTIGYYSFLLDFSSAELKFGNYVIYYKYYPSMNPYTITFDKSRSNQSMISDLSYYSESNTVDIDGLSIESLINFGYPLSLNTSIDSSSTGLSVYLPQTNYWAQFMNDESLIISPFATLTSVTINPITYSGTNYKQYNITYRITAEDGSSYSDYTHVITERTVNVESVFKNENEANINDLFAAREDELNTFTVDLGFDSTLNLYRLTGYYPYLSITYASLVDPIEGISHFVDDALFVDMTYETLPGEYDIIIEIYQDASTIISVDTLTITKNQGVDAYIDDIKFSSATTIVEYPVIRVTDSNGTNITTEYDPRIYFGGIDYDGADIGSKSPFTPEVYFRIDGAVSNTPLDQYVPNIVEYLPYGASIALGSWNSNTLQWEFGTPVHDGDDLQPLVANFTVDPKTGLPGDNVRIPYKVVSESDPNKWVIYYITVTDKTYNVTLNFNIYYCSGVPETCELVQTADEFNETLFMITVKNFIVYDNNVLVDVDDYDGNTNPALFPSFDEARTLENQMVQFYYPNTINHQYKLGRNRAGFFTFDLALPRDAYLNPLYSFEIKHDGYDLAAASLYDSRLVGYYYYIGKAEYNRTSNFDIYIRTITPSTDRPWGLYDFFRSWFDLDD